MKIHHRTLSLPIVATLFALQLPLHASVIVFDTFDIGSPPTVGNDAADPLDVAWQQNRGTLSVVDDAAGIGSGNAMQMQAGIGETFLNTWANFAPQALNVGDQISLSVDFRFTAAPQNSGSGVRFGLGDGTNGTYVFRLGSGTSAGGSWINNGTVDDGGTGGASSNSLTTTGTATAIGDTSAHNVVLTFTRMAGGMSLLATVDGTHEFSAADIGTGSFPLITDFSQIQLGSGSISNSYRYDNITVTYTAIPEPGTLALVGIALGSLLIFRRKWAR